MSWRIAAFLLATLVLALVPARIDGAMAAERSDEPSATLAEADWALIRSAIGEQLEALRSGDASRAFSFAATAIRAQFHDAPTFLRMVQNSYAVLLHARYTEFLEGALIEGRAIQPLRLVMNDETVLVALYEMQRDDAGIWRIAGCVVAPSTVRST